MTSLDTLAKRITKTPRIKTFEFELKIGNNIKVKHKVEARSKTVATNILKNQIKIKLI